MNRFIKLFVLLFVSFACASRNSAQTNSNASRGEGIILSSVPQKVDTTARYLLYLSGYIVTADNIRPTSPRFGVYQYEEILAAFKQKGFAVISEARKQTVDIEPYAEKVAGRVLAQSRSSAAEHHSGRSISRFTYWHARLHLFGKSPA